ncbi:hypothetical protein SAMN05216167_11587 [Spirosoma endophyticum]|uniref:Uncharacterized protein n=1 Tax=Spirosoma endophyticum TaxID=662367 RepID=A0A1I2BI68_9BACT|nr:hypothetical protein SAMN05216167_11587 [Spirosoma endophyticum]
MWTLTDFILSYFVNQIFLTLLELLVFLFQ